MACFDANCKAMRLHGPRSKTTRSYQPKLTSSAGHFDRCLMISAPLNSKTYFAGFA